MGKRFVIVRSTIPTASPIPTRNNEISEGMIKKGQDGPYQRLRQQFAPDDDTLADVGVPGMSKIFKRNYSPFGKVVWTIVILSCFIFCVMQITKRVNHYLSVPYNVDMDLEREKEATFPAVSVCPFYPFQFNLKFYDLIDEYLAMFDVNTRGWKLEDFLFHLFDMPNITASDLWQFGRVNYSEAYIVCQTLSTRKNCHLDVTREDFTTYLGICTKYQLSGPVKFDGPYNGMQLNFYDNENDLEIGMHYMAIVHHPDDDYTHLMYGNGGVYLSQNSWTQIKFVTKKYQRHNTSVRICKSRVEVQQCVNNCVERNIVKNVTCSLPYLRPELGLPECNNSATARRTYTHTLHVYDKLTDLCHYCPKPCQEYFYNGYDTIIETVPNITRVSILYYDNIAEIVKEIPIYTFDVLLADIGGSMGLFLGICLLSILQFIETLFVATKKSLFKCKGC